MNYFAHGRRFLNRPYFVAGTAIPDWMNVIDRRVRVHSKCAEPLLKSDEPAYREIAAGVMQHHADDDWFHRTRAFAELSLSFAVTLRDELPRDDGLRPSFLGHILVEMLLDDCLATAVAPQLADYYRCLENIEPQKVAAFVHTATGKPAAKLSEFIPRFLQSRFLYDYADNAKLLYRLNQVMGRVGLAEIPEAMLSLLPGMRLAVQERTDELLMPKKANR